MDALRRDDVERARTTPPAEKLRQALAMMAEGIELQRRKLRARDPVAGDDIIEERLRAWLAEPR